MNREWIFTFSFAHRHPITGAPLRNCYVAIPGDAEDARAQMVASFGTRWAMQYSSREEAGVARFNLQPIALPAVH